MSSKLPGMVAAAIAAFLPTALWLRPAAAQTTYTLVSSTTVAWGDAASWTGGAGGVPGLGDSVLVNAGTTTLNVNTNRSILNLDFSNPAGAVTITTATAATLTITGTLTKSGTAETTFRCLFTNGTPAFSLDIAKLDMTGSGNLNLGTTRQLQSLSVGEMTVNATSNLVAINTSVTSSGTAFIDKLTINTGRLLTGGGTAEVKSLAGSGTNGRIQASNTSGSAIGTLRIVGESGTSAFGGILAAGNANTNTAARLHLLKTGAGVQVLSGSSNYAGDVTINGGRLEVAPGGSISGTAGIVTINGTTADFRYNSSIGLNKPITLTQGVLSGTGAIAAALTVDSLAAVLSPGNSPGILTFGTSQSWGSHTYLWETNNFQGTTAGIDFDRIAITGGLTFTGTAAGSYVLDITSLTIGNVAGNVGNFADIDRAWTILTTTGGITGFDASAWSIQTTNFTSSPTWDGTWSVSKVDNDIVLSYVAVVPEPATTLLAVIGIGLGGWMVRVRRTQRLARCPQA